MTHAVGVKTKVHTVLLINYRILITVLKLQVNH